MPVHDGFTIDYADADLKPGMRRSDYNPQFLTPVFFDPEVLLRYFYRFNDTEITFYSETYGGISSSDFHMAFGINENGKVIAWYGDLKDLPSKEKALFQGHNCASDHKIDSEFFDAQMNVVYTSPIKEIQLIRSLEEINALCSSRYGFSPFLTKIDIKLLRRHASKYKRTSFGNLDDVKMAVNDWNQSLIESIDKDSIRGFLQERGVSLSSQIGSNKVLERFVIDILGDTNNTIAPMFYLYDLRIWATHKDAEENFQKVAISLGKNADVDPNDLYNVLIDKLCVFANTLKMLLK